MNALFVADHETLIAELRETSRGLAAKDSTSAASKELLRVWEAFRRVQEEVSKKDRDARATKAKRTFLHLPQARLPL